MALIPLMRPTDLVPDVRTDFTGAVRGYLTGRQAAQNRELQSQRLQDLSEARAVRAENRAVDRQINEAIRKQQEGGGPMDFRALGGIYARFNRPQQAMQAYKTASDIETAQANRDIARSNIALGWAKLKQGPKPTGTHAAYLRAKAQGYQGTELDYRKEIGSSAAPKVESEYDKAIGKAYGELDRDIQAGGRSARSANSILDAMETQMSKPGFYSGIGGERFVPTVKRMGRQFGFSPEGLEGIETFNALAKKAALENIGGSLGAGFSDADRSFVLEQVPTLTNTPEGNRELIRVTRAINERRQEVARLARLYKRRRGGRLDAEWDEFISQWASENPLFADERNLTAQDRIGASPLFSSPTGTVEGM